MVRSRHLVAAARAMKTSQFSDAYWTARFAPYFLAVALVSLVASFFWVRPQFGYLLVGVLSGVFVFVFHVLRWRTGRERFQILAMVSGLLPLFVVMRLHDASTLQYVAALIASYNIAVIFFRGRVLRELNPDAK